MIFGRYNLHCNSCNWEFVGFAIPGTISSTLKKSKRSSIKSADNSQNRSEPISQVAENKELSEDKKAVSPDLFNNNKDSSDTNVVGSELRRASGSLAAQLNEAAENSEQFDSVNSDYNYYKKDAERIKRRKRVRIKMKQ